MQYRGDMDVTLSANRRADLTPPRRRGSVRGCSSPDPSVQLRFERGERQHAVLELHLVERAYVEALAEACFGAGAHLRPFNAAERICKHEPRQSADQRHGLCCALG